MKIAKPFSIEAMGKYLPRAISSHELEKNSGLSKGWSLRHSGVLLRHHVTTESNAYMGAKAVENALAKSGVELSAIDMLISASSTYDYPIPNRASLIKHELKNGDQLDFPAIDVDTTCLSFVSALDYCAHFLDGKRFRTAAIVSSEISSKGLNPDNWETFTLFGDAAVAAIIKYDESASSGLIKSSFNTYTEGVFDTIIRGGGNQYFFRDHPYDKKLHSFFMNGKNLLKLAIEKIPGFIDRFFSDLDMTVKDCDWILPHQASKIGLSMFKKLCKLDEGKMLENISEYGNCIAASIPLLLHDGIEQNKIRRGDTCFLAGTSAGFSIGGLLLKY
ncbi:MAG: 3-oxoacyl-[acyl-carrier-protein] synthase III C-terminal domain-containing protein [Bacteroidales bacterium]